MISFKTFLGEAKLTASGARGQYDADKYITPYKNNSDSHRLSGPVDGLDHTKPVSVHGYEVKDGKYHATVSQNGVKRSVPFSKLHKPIETKNAGFDVENRLVAHLKKHNLMPKEASAAGSGAGNDFILHNRKTNVMHPGKEALADVLKGEVKKDKSGAFGQLTIHHTPEAGWHIKDRNRANRPEYAKRVQKHVISYLNKHHRDGNVPGDVNIPHPDLEPANAYLRDHHVDVLHIGSHGTYSIGKDKTGIGLPEFKGKGGNFRVRKKNQFAKENSLTVQFQMSSVKSLEKSPVNLENEDHLPKIKKALGVE